MQMFLNISHKCIVKLLIRDPLIGLNLLLKNPLDILELVLPFSTTIEIGDLSQRKNIVNILDNIFRGDLLFGEEEDHRLIGVHNLLKEVLDGGVELGTVEVLGDLHLENFVADQEGGHLGQRVAATAALTN